MHRAAAASLFGVLSILASPAEVSAIRTESAAIACSGTCAEVWPSRGPWRRLDEIGRGVAIVFSPDLTVPQNRAFYERLGFAYFDSPSWAEVLRQLHEYNERHPERRVELVLVESHGTNGHGLKLQSGKAASDRRSYIAVGALQEILGEFGIGETILSACNSGRLFRPEIYHALDPDPGDCLFLPPTLGIIDSAPEFTREHAGVRLLRRDKSNLETLMEGRTEELSPAARRLLERRDPRSGIPQPFRFVVSTMLIQLLTDDPRLVMTSSGYVEHKSSDDLSPRQSEALFAKFTRLLGEVASREAWDRAARE